MSSLAETDTVHRNEDLRLTLNCPDQPAETGLIMPDAATAAGGSCTAAVVTMMLHTQLLRSTVSDLPREEIKAFVLQNLLSAV